MACQSGSKGVKEAATRVRGNGTTVSLHELMLGRGFDAAVGDIPRYIMKNGGAPFKTERVEVERHQEEVGGRMVR